MTPAAGVRLPGVLDSRRLDNGLEVLLLESADAPVVSSALTYRVGALHEPAGRSGLAHYLEHMMFKGSQSFEAGEIDRRTRALGGSNNAFTTHDSTTYFFSFAAGRATEALEIEADRMRGLTNAVEEVERERAVILEEMAMYEAEPWEALDRAVQSELFGEHPYGRPIIGLRSDVESIGRVDLEDFHRRFYRPSNAVLVVAGAVDDTVEAAIDRCFGAVGEGDLREHAVPSPGFLDRAARVELERGSIDRFVLAVPTPRPDHEDFAALRMIGALLTAGRSSRLNDRLVERENLCSWVSSSLSEGDLGGALYVAGEVVPGAGPPGSSADRVEEIVREEIARLCERDCSSEALARAARMAEADWVFAHERIENQALTLSQAAAGPGASYPVEQLTALAALDERDVRRVAGRYLDLDAGSVFGWSRAVAT